MSKIGITGLWHLGCVLCASWAQLGHEVVGHDPDEARIAALRQGVPPIFEPGLAEALRSPGLVFSSDYADLGDCEFVFVALDTPVDEEDHSLTGPVEEIVVQLAPVLRNEAIVIVSAQSPVGFCARLRRRLQEVNPTLELAYSPENLRLGEALQCYLHPGRVILGTASEACRVRCQQLFSALDGEIQSMGLASAEAVKHGINSFLAMSIVYTNQLANLCEVSGAKIDEVVAGMKSDPRIGTRAYLEPGVGFSGGTLGRDLKVLSSIDPEPSDFFGLLWRLNQSRKDQIVARLQRLLPELPHLRVGVLGLTYKPGTSTLRRSLPLAIVEQLVELGCQVNAYDPKADISELDSPPRFSVALSADAAARGADLLLLLTAWPEFRELPWQEWKAHVRTARLFDTKNLFQPAAMQAQGWEYFSLGR